MESLSFLMTSLKEIDITYVLLFAALLAAAIYIIVYHPFGFGFMEGFNSELASGTNMENAHGSAPAGVNASPGSVQHDLNEGNQHVDHVNQDGNPQNTNPDLKKQPSVHA